MQLTGSLQGHQGGANNGDRMAQKQRGTCWRPALDLTGLINIESTDQSADFPADSGRTRDGVGTTLDEVLPCLGPRQLA